MTEENDAGVQFVAPYVAWKTILNQLDRFEPGMVPPRIDRSILNNLSGGYRGQVMSAFRNLGFIDSDGTVTTHFRALVANPEDRPNIIAGILRQRYPEAVKLAEENASYGDLEEAFRNNYGVSGSTLIKAITFYLAAANYANLPVSAHWRTPKQPKTSTPRTGAKRTKKTSDVRNSNDQGERGDSADSVATLRVRYVEILLKKAEAADDVDADLLDRIETVLGYGNQPVSTEPEVP